MLNIGAFAQVDGSTGPSDAESEALRERVIARWNAVMADDRQAAYAFALPSYRKLYAVDDYLPRMGGPFANPAQVGIRDIQIDGERGILSLDVERRVLLPGSEGDASMTTTLSEVWLLRDGLWWHVPTFAASDGSVAP